MAGQLILAHPVQDGPVGEVAVQCCSPDKPPACIRTFIVSSGWIVDWLAARATAPATTSCAGLSAPAVLGGLVLPDETPASGALEGRAGALCVGYRWLQVMGAVAHEDSARAGAQVPWGL